MSLSSACLPCSFHGERLPAEHTCLLSCCIVILYSQVFASKHLHPAIPPHVEGFVAHAHSAPVFAQDCIVSVAWHIDTNNSDEFQSLWIVTVVSAKGGWT